MTTPAAAAPAAIPAAAPAAPAPAPVPAPAAPAAVTPPAASAAAPAPAAAPAAAPAPAPVPAVAAPVPAVAAQAPTSLLDGVAPLPAAAQTPEEQLAAAKAVVAAHEAAADPNGGKAWLLIDGVMGAGEKPGWLNTSKYKSVAAQAEAYSHLEKRFGSFVGAPAEGKYTINLPENVDVKTDSPLMQEFTKWAAKEQLSQDGYNQLLGFLVQDVASRQPNMATIKSQVGENADARLNAIIAWGRANLDATPVQVKYPDGVVRASTQGFELLRQATSGPNAAAVFKTLEALIGKTAQVRMPKPGDDVPGASGSTGRAAVEALQAQKGPDGKRLYGTDPAHTKKVNDAWLELGRSSAQQ